jgi:hypothetical protein
MSIQAIAYVQELTVGDYAAKLLLYVIAENTYNDSGLSKVGQAVLMRQCEMSESTLRRKLNLLKALGLVRTHVQAGSGTGRHKDAVELVGFLDHMAGRQPVIVTGRGQPVKSGGGNRSLLTGTYKDTRTRHRTSEVKIKTGHAKGGSTSIKILEEDRQRDRRHTDEIGGAA